MENREWDFMAVCYDSIDHVCHDFAIFHPPKVEQVSERVPVTIAQVEKALIGRGGERGFPQPEGGQVHRGAGENGG